MIAPRPGLRVREGARQTMAWLHGWTGLLLGWLLFVIALAGSLAVFRPEIGRWARPEVTRSAPPAEAAAAAVGWLSRHAAGSPAWYLALPGERGGAVEAAWSDGTGFVRRALDPVTGAPVARDTLGGEFYYRLHFDLQLPFPWGRLLASLAAAFMLVAIITGIVTHARIFRDIFTFREGKGQRSWLDAHNAFGVLSLPFHVMITFTGLVTLATTTMPWGIAANYGHDTARMFAEFLPGAVDHKPTGRTAPLAPVAPMLREAERRFGGVPIGAVAIVAPGDAAATVSVTRSDARDIARAAEQVTFDGSTGRVLVGWRERGRPAVSTYNVLYGLHMAHFGRALVRWLYFVGGLMLTATIATGLVLWTVKRRRRDPGSRANRMIERLNVGMIAGTPTAFAAYLWANRLLPATLADRAAHEVAAALWVWGAVLVAAAGLSSRRGWRTLLALAAIACGGVPLLDLLLPGAPLPPAVLRGDGAIVGTDAVLAVAAAAFAGAARGVARAHVAPPVRIRRARAVVAA